MDAASSGLLAAGVEAMSRRTSAHASERAVLRLMEIFVASVILHHPWPQPAHSQGGCHAAIGPAFYI
jgi:hypothetical protein